MKQGKGRAVLAVALISGASLGYELLLLRFFSLMYWDHFAHLIISMALLGFGLSGSVLSLCQHRLVPAFPRWFAWCGLSFAITLLIAASLAGRLGFNPPEVIWQAKQMGRLAAVFVVATVPFFFAGLCIGLTMRCHNSEVARIYRADLCGAAGGALLIFALLFVWPPQYCIKVLAVFGVLAAMIGGMLGRSRWGRLAVAGLVVICALWPERLLTPVMSEYKGLSQSLLVPGVRVAATIHSPMGESTALRSDQVPFRFAPGLSLMAPSMPPEQIALFQDGHAAGMLLRGNDGPEAMEFLRWTPMALPYALLDKRPHVLVAGAGGGGDVWHALIEQAVRIDAVEPNRALASLAETVLAPFTDSIFQQPGVHLHLADIRGFLTANADRYDVIQISPLGSAVPPAAGSGHALETQPLYTIEGLRLALSRLTPDGLLSLTLPLELPPRGAVKAAATLAAALQQLDRSTDPFAHLAIIRTWNTATLVAARAPFSERQREAVRAFCSARAFDLDWLPGLPSTEVNRVNILDRPYLYEAVQELRQGLPNRQLATFNLAPATDDRPWFSHFFRWSSLPSLWALRTSGGAALLEWEYLLLWISLAVTLAISLPAILLPLRPLFHQQGPKSTKTSGYLAGVAYFAALGLAFFLIEIAFIQQWMLFLGDPMVAMAVIVPSFLLFAGLGSGAVDRMRRAAWLRCWPWGQERPVTLVSVAITAVACLYLWLLPLFFQVGAGWPPALRVVLSVLFIGGLAFWMGMPFPLGLLRLADRHPQRVPLAWGVNGLFSVLSTILATVLALHLGFTVVVGCSLFLYLVAAALERRM